MRKRMKRALAFCLCLILCLSLLPASVFAAETEDAEAAALPVEFVEEPAEAEASPAEEAEPVSEPVSEAELASETEPAPEETSEEATPAEEPTAEETADETSEVIPADEPAAEEEPSAGDAEEEPLAEDLVPLDPNVLSDDAEEITEVEDSEEEDETEEEELFVYGSDSTDPVWTLPSNTARDNDDLLDAYLNQILESGLPSRSNGPRKAPRNLGGQLSGADAFIYGQLHDLISAVANGESTAASITITRDYEWTKAQLGVSAILDETQIFDENGNPVLDENGNPTYTYTINSEAMRAGEALSDFAGVNYRLVIDSLLADCPYELYWFDKTVGCSNASNFAFTGSQYRLQMNETLTIKLAISKEYAMDDDAEKVDASAVQAAITAAENAQTIVSNHAAENALTMLASYRDEICALTSYNSDAAAQGDSAEYGNPWQIIWVFDGDETTEVVCEGYAKAFQYLCDLSTNLGSSISCYTVTGVMSGATGAGNHMWNIVNMDGYNYLVDVTNCDTGTVGHPDKLFMRSFAAGSVGTQYVVTCGESTVTYSYSANTLALFSSSDLALRSIHPKDDIYTMNVEPGAAFTPTVTAERIDTGNETNLSRTWRWRSTTNGVDWDESHWANTAKTRSAANVYSNLSLSGFNSCSAKYEFCFTGTYHCDLTGKDETESVTFTVVPTLSAYIRDTELTSSSYLVTSGSFTARVSATGIGTLYYRWYHSDDGGNTWSSSTSSQTATAIGIRVPSPRIVKCEVSDNFGSKQDVYFYLNVPTEILLDTNTTASALSGFKETWFSFTPTENGSYWFRSLAAVSGVNAELLDANLNVLASSTGDSLFLTADLAAGTTYYYRVYKADGALTPCTVKVSDTYFIKLNGESLSLKGNIRLNYYLDLPEDCTAANGAYATFNGVRAPIGELTDNGYGYLFPYYVTAKEMQDEITLRIYSADGTPYPLLDREGNDITEEGYVYSVSAYFELARASAPGNTALMNLIDRMSNYGICAQIQFNHNTETAIITPDMQAEFDAITTSTLEAYIPTVPEGAVGGLTYDGGTLTLKSQTFIRHYFTVDEAHEIGDYRFTVNGSAATPTLKSGQQYYVEILDIAAKDLDTVYPVEVTTAAGVTVMSLGNYSALSYAYRVLSNDAATADIKNLVKALYLYNQAANAYFQ